MPFSLHDDASDDDNEFVERMSEQWNGMVSEVRDTRSELLHVRELL